MKFLVLADIHGSIKYLNIAMEKFNKLNCEKILLLGDILYHGPRNDLPLEYKPKEVISLLNSYKDKILCVKGNCDAEVDEMVLEFPLYPIVMLNVGGVKLELIHGHNLDECEGEGYILHGHTHVNKYEDGIINIGSLSIPKDNHHTYAVIEDSTLTSYDLFTDEVIMSVKL
jgi:putative phosphoesterase